MTHPSDNLSAYHARLARRDFGLFLCACFIALPVLALAWRVVSRVLE